MAASTSPWSNRTAVDVTLTLQWQLGGEKDLIGTVTDAFQDSNGDICLLDAQQQTLVVYGQDGKYIRSMGRSGDGPGESWSPRGAFALPDGYAVIHPFPVRLITYDWQGIPKGDILPVMDSHQPEISVATCSDGCAWNERIVLACIFFRQDENGRHIREELALHGRNGGKLRTLFGVTHQAGVPVVRELEDNYYLHRFVADSEHLFVAPDFDKYEIHVFGLEDTRASIIRQECTPPRRTPEEIKRIGYSLGQERIRNKDVRFEIMDHHRAIEQVDLGPDNQLWVLSGEGAWRSPEGTLGIFDVYSPESLSLVRRVRLHSPDSFPSDFIWIIGDKVIVVKYARDLLLGLRDARERYAGDLEAQVICYTIEHV